MIDVSTLTEYTWAQIATAAKVAMVNAALGGATYSINGRQLGRITVKDAKALYELAQQMIADETATDGPGIGLAGFGERQ